MYQIALTKKAAKEFSKLPKSAQKQIAVVIDQCESDPWSCNYKKLKTPFPGFRIRSGDYRILFTTEENLLTIYSIANRKSVYKR